MSERVEHRSRRMWRAVEPVHAVTYFAPESQAACEALGTRGFWMSYFALRAAALGAASAELVTALFYNFHPGLVRRAVPAVWSLASPERFREIRTETVDAALRRLLGSEVIGTSEMAEAAEIAREAALAAPTAGRALAAANTALEWPEAPHLVLWHAQTVLREHRGDGHVAALLTAGLDPVETLVLFAAGEGLDADVAAGQEGLVGAGVGRGGGAVGRARVARRRRGHGSGTKRAGGGRGADRRTRRRPVGRGRHGAGGAARRAGRAAGRPNHGR